MGCSFVKQAAGGQVPRVKGASSSGKKEPLPSPDRSKSPKLLESLTKPFRRSGAKPEEAPLAAEPIPPSSARPRRSLQAEVVLPLLRKRAPSAVSPSPVEFPEASDVPPPSPYLQGHPFPSSTSLASRSSSFVSLDPNSPEYHYELERLRIQFKASQENLRIAREAAEAQRVLFEQDRAATQQRHQQQLDDLVRQYSASSADKGKRRER